jgi:PAS domain S-box-containing protein
MTIGVEEGKKAEEQSRFLAQLQVSLNVLPAYTWYAAPSGALTFVNKRTADYLGLPKDHPLRFGIDIGAQWDAHIPFLHPDDQKGAREAWPVNIRTGEASEFSFRVRNAQGGYRWFLSRAEPLRASDGSLLLWVGVNLDIEELKGAEQALREREAKIRRLVDSNVIGIFVWDFEGRFLEANNEFLRMVGYDREELLAGSIRWTDLTPPDWRDRNNARMERGKSSGRFEAFEKEYTRKDGNRVPVLIGGATFEVGGNEGVAFVLDLTERKRAEEKSRESELKLRQITETVPGLVWSNGPDGEPTHVNQRMLDYSGMPFEEFRHRGWEPFVHPADFPETVEAFYRAIQTGTSYEGVMRLRRADGEFLWHHARCEPLCDGQGRIIQWYGLAVDVEERKKAEEGLRRSALENAHLYRDVAEREKQLTATSEVLRTIANAPSDIQSALDAVAEHAARLCGASNARIWRLEDNALRLVASYGESSATMDGREGLPADRDTVTGRAACDRRTIHVHDIAAEDSEYPLGSRIVKGQGWHTTLATPLLREGTPVGIILVRRMEVRPFHDQQIALLEIFADQAAIAIENVRLFESEKQRSLALAHANRDLAEREEKIRRLVDSNIIGIFIWDFDGRILEANDEFLRMVSYDREDLVSGRIRWADLTPPDWRDRNNARIEQQRGGGRFEPFEKEYTRKDGRHVPILIGGATFEEGGNEGVAYVLDLTVRKRVEAEARASEQRYRTAQLELAHANRVATMGQLTASITHEVNQPITAAVTYALAARRLLSAKPPNLHEVDDVLSLIVKEGNRAGEVVGRVRALIKKAPARKDAVEINDAILEIIALTRTEAANNSVSVRTQLAEGLPHVVGDRVQLQQVLLNLIINAIEAMRDVGEEERELLISTRHEPDGVSVEVRDSGPGFAPADIDRVFEAFYSTKPSGVGLGLSICRSIIEAHDGRLWARPNVPRGAVFGFIAPAHPAGAQPAGER